MKEQVIAKIKDIIANEKFRLDAFFLCGAAANLPNKDLQTACEAYLEMVEVGGKDQTVTDKMIAELETAVSTDPKIKVRGDLTDNTKDLQFVLDNRAAL